MSFQDAMTKHVGRGRWISVNALAADTGLKPRTIRSYLDGTTPPFDVACRIMRVMPEAFKLMALADAGIIRVEAQTSDEACIGRLQAGAARLVSVIAEARADGIVDHREVIDVERELWRFDGTSLAFRSARSRP